MLVWMDLEMTGLDHTSDVIVEIATLITDDDLRDHRRGPGSRDPPGRRHPRPDGSGRGRDAHAIGIDRLDPGVEGVARRGRRGHPRVHQDARAGTALGAAVRQLDRHRPALPRPLPARRSRITSTTAASTCRPSRSSPGGGIPSLDNERPFKVGAHRALDDIRDSVRELQFYRERVFIPARPVVVRAERVDAVAADPRPTPAPAELSRLNADAPPRRAMLTECVPSPSRRTEDPTS